MDARINAEEQQTARRALQKALDSGAQKVRISVCKSTMDLIDTLNGEVDKVSHCLDRSMMLSIFVDGRFSSFSTNRLDGSGLDEFISRAVQTTRLLAQDPCRDLPAKERTETGAVDGMELDLYDPAYESVTAEMRRKAALSACAWTRYPHEGEGMVMISEEGEYSTCLYDTLVIDSNGLYCRHIETTYDYSAEVTAQDPRGHKYSGLWWDSKTRLSDVDLSKIGDIAWARACEQAGARKLRSGKRNMVIDTEVASKLVTPILNALNAYSIQQGNSFLCDSVGRKLFPEGMTITDLCRQTGATGSRLFDSEGVATKETDIIEGGVVKQYFVNTYMSNKMGIQATVEDITRPVVRPWPRKGLDRSDIMQMCGEGILVTGFNGGNSNTSTGDFSYGVEGFAFKDGKITKPVHEMVVTGNFLTLWAGLIAAGDDARPCMSRLIPTLAFSNVDFS